MTRIVLVGAGAGGTALVELFRKDPSLEIIGVADKNERAPGLILARELGLHATTSYKKLLAAEIPDLIIDVTGDPEVARDLQQRKASATELVGGSAARFIWNLFEVRNRTEALEDKYQLALRELEARQESEFIIGANPKMKEISDLIDKVAPTPTTVLIRGESGTGKELVARAIHRRSALSNQPLVTLNCTALSPALLESELFGHKRGAFTGAYSDRKGLFEKAHGGTMFLDEIGDMSLSLQTRLLRVLEEQEVRPLGTSQCVKVELHVICASHRNLREMITRGEFREDLYYRLNGITLELPALHRRRDKDGLIRRCLARESAGQEPAAIELAALEQLTAYEWPGNIRELRNVIRRALAICENRVIRLGDLPDEVRHCEPAPSAAAAAVAAAADAGEPRRAAPRSALAHAERQALLETIERHHGHMTQVAAQLGVSRNTLYRKLKRHGIAVGLRRLAPG